MPGTTDLNEYWSITTRPGDQVGPRQWRATARVWRRDTHRPVGPEHVGEGGARTSAEARATEAAKNWAGSQARPVDWAAPET